MSEKSRALRKERLLWKKKRAFANRLFALGAACMVLFLIFIVLVKTVNVAPIGPQETSVGFSAINGAFHALTGFSKLWYLLAKGLGILAILVVAFFAGVGLFQLIKRRGIQNVDRTILATGGLYAVMLMFYVLFEKVVINYRPIIMEGETAPEASFPSSHTLMGCVVFGSAIMIAGRYFGKTLTAYILQILAGILLLVAVISRLVCGVHWLTDIVGGVLLSGALLSVYGGVITIWRSANRKKKKKKEVQKEPEFEWEE